MIYYYIEIITEKVLLGLWKRLIASSLKEKHYKDGSHAYNRNKI